MNAIGTQLRDPINSGLTRWRMAVINEYMDAAAELGRNSVSKHQIQPEYMEMSRLTRDGTAERTRLARPNSQARTRTGKYSFSCSADHVQDWQPYPVDPYSCYMCDHTYPFRFLFVWRVRRTFFLPNGVFLPCDHGLDFWHQLSCENSINQSVKRQLSKMLGRLHSSSAPSISVLVCAQPNDPTHADTTSLVFYLQ